MVSLPSGRQFVTGGTLSSSSLLQVAGCPGKGTARTRRRHRPSAPANALVVEVHAREEKGSDVNLAAHLLNDAWSGLFDAAVVVSNHTDLVAPIRMVAVERKKPAFVGCPGRWPMAVALQELATYRRHINLAMLSASQFPNPIPGTTISRPPGW